VEEGVLTCLSCSVLMTRRTMSIEQIPSREQDQQAERLPRCGSDLDLPPPPVRPGLSMAEISIVAIMRRRGQLKPVQTQIRPSKSKGRGPTDAPPTIERQIRRLPIPPKRSEDGKIRY
jgi:hypothetical protein